MAALLAGRADPSQLCSVAATMVAAAVAGAALIGHTAHPSASSRHCVPQRTSSPCAGTLGEWCGGPALARRRRPAAAGWPRCCQLPWPLTPAWHVSMDQVALCANLTKMRGKGVPSLAASPEAAAAGAGYDALPLSEASHRSSQDHSDCSASVTQKGSALRHVAARPCQI